MKANFQQFLLKRKRTTFWLHITQKHTTTNITTVN